jgi:NADH:ubiquinone reductase (H+-translocating)
MPRARSSAPFAVRPKPFRYRDKGTLASIGRGGAVTEIGRIRLSGVLAGIAWLGVHMLIGFRNRIIVMAEWAWLYLRDERGARLITGDVEPLLDRGHRERPQVDRGEAIRRAGIRVKLIP